MMAWKKSLVLGCVVGVLALVQAQPARADGVIYTGGKAGSYFTVFGPLVKEILAKQFFHYQVVESPGSVENLKQVAASPSSLALVQTDILAGELSRSPELASKIVVVRSDVASECAFAVTSPANAARLANWGDVEGFGHRIRLATGPAGSGSAATLGFILSLSDSLKDAPVINAENAVAAVTAVAEGKADVAFFVQVPDLNSAIFKQIVESKLTYVSVVNRAILRQTAKETPVYTATEVKVSQGVIAALRGGSKLTTVCTPIAYIAGNPDLLPAGNPQTDMRELIQKLRATDVAALRPKESWFKQALENSVRATGAQLDALLKAADDGAKALTK